MKRYKLKNLNVSGGSGATAPSLPARGPGRPSLYKTEYVEQVQKLCLLGATDKEICDFFKINNQTLHNWKARYSDFAEAMKVGKDVADNRVERSLYQRACGYSHQSEKIFNNRGTIVTHKYVEHYPPETTACIFWLKNRKPENWREKVIQEHTGKDGNAIEFSVADQLKQELDKLSVPSMAQIMAGGKSETKH